jgi:hypothetical protein
VDGDVVAATEQYQVGKVGAPTTNPVDDVVGIAPLGRRAAAGELAAAVAVGEGSKLCGTHDGRAAP